VQRPEGRELPASLLIETLRSGEIFEPVLAKVGQGNLDELSRRRRHKHLSAVPGGGYASDAMHVGSDVPLVGDKGCSSV
jgi:hypothetical protein